MSTFDANEFANTKADGYDNAPPPPPGMYEVVLMDARAFSSDKGDFVVLKWRIATGADAGYLWDDLGGFKSEGARRAIKAKSQTLGLDVDSITSLEDYHNKLTEQVGNWYTVEVKQNGSYRNTYLNGKVPHGQTDTPAGDMSGFTPQPAQQTDNVPF